MLTVKSNLVRPAKITWICQWNDVACALNVHLVIDGVGEFCFSYQFRSSFRLCRVLTSSNLTGNNFPSSLDPLTSVVALQRCERGSKFRNYFFDLVYVIVKA